MEHLAQLIRDALRSSQPWQAISAPGTEYLPTRSLSASKLASFVGMILGGTIRPRTECAERGENSHLNGMGVFHTDPSCHIEEGVPFRIQNGDSISHLCLVRKRSPTVIRVERDRHPDTTRLDDEPQSG
jgi:hypothetical protein